MDHTLAPSKYEIVAQIVIRSLAFLAPAMLISVEVTGLGPEKLSRGNLYAPANNGKPASASYKLPAFLNIPPSMK